MATKAKSGKHTIQTAPISADVDGEHGTVAFVSEVKMPAQHRRRKPPQVKESPELNAVITIEDRLKKLSRLPSLQKPAETEPVMPGGSSEKAVRPPDPTPPILEPEPSKHVDRGATIPDNYGLDRLMILPRDAHWLFAYWELHGGALERLRFQHSAEIIDNARWVLRVRPNSESTHVLVDIDLRVKQWYLNVSPGTRLTVDLGFIDQQGQFVEVVKGNTVTTPRAGISPVGDERWAIMREELEKLLHASGAETLSAVSSDRQLMRSEQPRAIGIFSSHLLSEHPAVRAEGSESGGPPI